ncbi:protein CROWDED NUCLEI 3-like [Lotus japonicus]|uniref:protein CROWDED NUCLEI 3-like n=1 Tax=Lotus japonicus TaxID=34305 RepID=UPI002586DCB9|nr:protein CROWDED NUCLEI 3-like [Lotus japonicus]
MKVKGEYISLFSARGSGLFTLFRSNYKHWKAKFFKLRESEKSKDIFYFDDGTPRFPFYWTDKPELIYKVPESSLTIDEKFEVDFLSTIHLNHYDFYEAFRERNLAKFVAKMSRLSEDDILRFRREHQALKNKPSPAKTLIEPEGSHSKTDKNPAQKRRKKNQNSEKPQEKTVVQSSMEKFVVKGVNQYGSSNAPPPSQKYELKEFEDMTSEEVTSLWDSRINFNTLVETNLVFEADIEKIRKIGLPEACQAVMTKSLEIAAISKMIEIESNNFDVLSSAEKLEDKEKENAKLKSTMKLLEKYNKANEKKAADLALELEKLRKTLEENQALMKAKEEETQKMKEEANLFASENKDLKKSVADLSADTASFKTFILS